MEPRRELLNEMGYEDLVVFENPSYDSAIIGVNQDQSRVVYDFEKMVGYLMEHDDMEYEEAVEFIEYNTIRAIPYFPNGPIVIYPIDDYFSEEPLTKEFDVKKVHEDLVKWIRDWFDKNGKGCNAVIGISGGKDSTICAALCAEALGPDRVIGVSIPDKGQDDSEAKHVAEVLGIRLYTFSIDNITGAFEESFWEMVDHNGFDKEGAERKEHAEQNLPPRVRMCVLYYVAQTFNGRVAETCNLSENYLGYCSRWGDEAGDFSPLGKLTTAEVKAIGDDANIPHELVWKVPDDGLPHSKPDEEKFGFSYDVLDKYIREGACEDDVIREKIDSMHAKSQFKRNSIKLPTFDPWE